MSSFQNTLLDMAQYNAAKNPPWAREASAMAQQGVPGVGGLTQAQVGMANTVLTQPGVATPTIYSLGNTQQSIAQQQYAAQQLGVATMQQQAQAALQQAVQLPQPGIAIPTTLATTQVATVSYPAPRLAPGPMPGSMPGPMGPGPMPGPPQQQQQQQQQPPPQPQAPPQQPPKQRVFTGTVTKLHDNFGFVDEDVFFQTSCVKGMLPKVGDRVLVEAAYNANMPFKWNATRIQVLPNQVGINPTINQGQGGPNFGPQGNTVSYNLKQGGGPQITPSAIPPPNLNQPPPLMGQQAQPAGNLMQAPGRSGPPMRRQGMEPSFRDRDRGSRGGDRDRGHPRDRSAHERIERRVSPRKRSRSPRRSKSPSASRTRSPQRGGRRGAARVVPRYMVQIPKLSLDTKDANVIALRSRYSNLYVPSDFFNAAFSWMDGFPMHRPLQLGKSCTFHVMHKEVEPLEKLEAVYEPADADHLYSAKVMLLSSPMLEELQHKSCALAEDPAEQREGFQHPTRLLQFLVGLKGKSEPMAIGGPWSPTLDGADPAGDPRVLINTAIRTTRALIGIDLSACTQWYRFTEIRYHRPEEMHKGRLVPARVETVVIFLPDVWSVSPTRLEWEQLQAAYRKQLCDKISGENKDESQEDEEEEEGAEEKKDPSHFSELDPKNMKVTDLRAELEARTLSSKGLKSQLIARLTKAIKGEQEKEEQEAESKSLEEVQEKPVEEEMPEVDEKEEERKRKEEEERKRREEREKVCRERRYNLPDNPAILVHPSTTAKSGKFDCTAMSLSVLLDYRPEDNKEHSFEVSLFAELFNEMLMRDFGFHIYRALVAAPPKKEEEKEKEKEKEKGDKDKKPSKDKDDKKKEEKEGKDKEDAKTGGDEPTVKKRRTEDEEEKKERKDSRDEKEDSKDEEMEEDRRSGGVGGGGGGSSSSSSREKDKDKDKKRDKVKYFSAERELLLAFVYFDQSHTGYLLDRDVEDLVHTLGLQLSRAQVKKLVQKMVTRDTLNYRKVTDRPMKEVEREGEEKEGEEKDPENAPPDVETLASGNKPLLPLYASRGEKGLVASPKTKRSLRRESGAAGAGAGTPSPTTEPTGAAGGVDPSGMVVFRGAVIDVASVMQKLEKSEKGRAAIETKLKDNIDQMETLKTNFSAVEQTSQQALQEVTELKRRLRDERRAADQAEASGRRMHDMLLRTQGALSTVLDDVRDLTAKEAKDSKDSKDFKDSKDSKDAKDLKESKDSKDVVKNDIKVENGE